MGATEFRPLIGIRMVPSRRPDFFDSEFQIQ
jgi:hypothetical protein